MVRRRHRRGRPGLRPRRRPARRQLLHAADHGLRRRPVRLRQRRPARHLPAPQRRAPTGRPTGCSRRQPDGTFKDVSAGSGLDIAGYGMGVAVGDVNNDGRPDVLVTAVRRRPAVPQQRRRHVHRRHRRRPGWTTRCGAPRPPSSTTTATAGSTSSSSTTSITTRPGRCTHAGGQPRLLPPQGLSRAPSPGCSTTSASRAPARPRPLRGRDARVRPRPAARARAWAWSAPTSTATAGPTSSSPTTASPTTCGSTSKDGTFKEEAVVARRGLQRAWARPRPTWASPRATWTATACFDLFVTHLTEETQHPLAAGAARLVPATGPRRRPGSAALARHRLRHGAGRLRPRRRPRPGRRQRPGLPGPPAGHRPLGALLETLRRAQPAVRQRRHAAGSATSRRATRPSAARPTWPAAWPSATSTATAALDLLVTPSAGRPGCYRNVAPERGHWLLVRAVDPRLKRDAYGAEVTVQAGGRTLVGWINPGQATCAATTRAPTSAWGRPRRRRHPRPLAGRAREVPRRAGGPARSAPQGGKGRWCRGPSTFRGNRRHHDSPRTSSPECTKPRGPRRRSARLGRASSVGASLCGSVACVQRAATQRRSASRRQTRKSWLWSARPKKSPPNPRSAQAWGQLGMTLLANKFEEERSRRCASRGARP